MTISFNTDPYYDDFNPDKGYHRVLFKPDVAIQSRELTQLQSIQQHQIKTFGDHVFKHGSVVIPGNLTSDLDAPYVTVSSNEYTLAALNGITLVHSSGISASVIYAASASVTDEMTIYLSYNSGAGSNSNNSTFVAGDVITAGAIELTVTGNGKGSLVSISQGTYYINGAFVNVLNQSTILSRYTRLPSAHVLLKITESVVSAAEDTTLLDPSNGSFNFSSPGADRYKIKLDLVTLPLGASITEDYVEVMRYNAGVLELHSRYPAYNELGKSLARRTYDESGDYVVNGLTLTTTEHKKIGLNGGLSAIGDVNKFVANVAPGKAYVKGFEVETISPTNVILDKARSPAHIKTRKNVSLNPSFGQYLFVNEIKGMPNLDGRGQLTIYNQSVGGSIIGTATVLSIDLHETTADKTTDIYKLFVTDVALANDILLNAGRVSWLGGSSGGTTGGASVIHKLKVYTPGASFVPGQIITGTSLGVATVVKYTRNISECYVSKHSAAPIPLVKEQVTAVSGAAGTISSILTLVNNKGNSLIVELPEKSVYRVKTAQNESDVSYRAFKSLKIALNGAGSGSASVSGMTIDNLDFGNILVTSSAGVEQNSLTGTASLSADGRTISITGGALNGTLEVVVSVTKNAISAKSKVYVQNFTETSTNGQTIQLSKADVYKINSVSSTVDGDVTNRYTLDNGQRDYAYLRGTLTLRGGQVQPGGTITVVYDYFNHSGTGDYFSIDSYETSNLADYYANVPSYVSKTDGKLYNLKNCLDFRARQGDDGQFTSSSGGRVDFLQSNSRITLSLSYYIPRIDLIVLNKDGRIQGISGIPAINPEKPQQPSDTVLLGTIFVPAYTELIRELIVEIPKNRVYTMKDIGKLENRVYNIEQFTLLSASERELLDFNVQDAETGLTRFKSGYLVESFLKPEMVCDIFDEDFTTTFSGSRLLPKIEPNEVDLVQISLVGGVLVDSTLISLNYTTTTFAAQPLSSRITNLNPFLITSWTGILSLTPSQDSWVDLAYAPDVFSTRVNNVYKTVDIPRPWTWAPAGGDLVRRSPISPPIFVNINGEGFSTRAAAVVNTTEIRQVPNGGGGGCFIGTTLVRMSDYSLKKIEDIKIGDFVLNHNLKSVNKVMFLETITDSTGMNLFSPDGSEPFATTNHPIYIDGTLSSVHYNNGYSDYPWLGKVNKINPASVIESDGQKVYNLWLSGDATYIVNGYGTTSILGDGRALRMAYEYGYVNGHDIEMLISDACKNKDTLYGAVIMNNVLAKLNIKLLINIVVSMSKSNKMKRYVNVMQQLIGKCAWRLTRE